MGLDDAALMQIVLGTALFVLGVIVGVLAARGGEGAKARALRLEEELEEARERMAGYEDQVAKHFAQTSELFGDLTRQHTAVWDHLAEGSRDLCADRVPAIGRGFADVPRLLTQTPTNDAEPSVTDTPGEPEADPTPTPPPSDPAAEDESPARLG